jgi:hypothetical protein
MFHHIRRRPFINFIAGRSGSSLLTSYINQLPDLICYGEILVGLSCDEQAAMLQLLSQGARIEPRYPAAADPTYFLIPPWRKHDDEIVAVGLKVKYGDLEGIEATLNFLREANFQVMYTIRKSIIRVVLSRLRSRELYEKTGGYTNMDPSNVFSKITVDVEQFEKLLVKERRHYDDLNDIVTRSGCPIIGVEYEALVSDTANTLNRIAEFLGSSYRITDRDPGFNLIISAHHAGGSVVPLVTTMFKVTEHDMRSVVYNYDELQRHFSNTIYASEFV